MKLVRLPVFVILLLAALTALARNDHYDEVYDEKGNPRPGYREALPIFKNLSPEEIRKLERQTKKDFQGDNILDLFPRIITKDEETVLRRGIEQRGTAIRMFLQDYFAGNNRTVYKLIPKDVIDRLTERTGDKGFRGLVDPKAVAFPYGPDLIRAPDGSWRVVEDNHGYIGGIGDLVRARETLYRRMPEYQQMIPSENNPEGFYRDLVERFKKMAKPPGSKAIVYAIGSGDDHEDARLKKIFRDLGVDYVSPYTKQKLEVDKAGVWVRNTEGRRERVGYMFLSGEPHDVDVSHKVNYGNELAKMIKKFIAKRGDKLDLGMKYVLEDAIKINKKTGTYDVALIETALEFTRIPNAVKGKLGKIEAKGLLEAMLDGRVVTSYTPGTEFVSDKEFYVYVEDMIRHYLGEEPILKNIPTQKFRTNTGNLDKVLLNRVMKNPDGYVIKAVDGRGGDSVWVGPMIAQKEFRAVRVQIEKNPERFIVQEYTPLSVIQDKIGDIRGYAFIDAKGAVSGDSFFARVVPRTGNGKVNIGSRGREAAVLTIDPKKFTNCSEKFSALRARR